MAGHAGLQLQLPAVPASSLQHCEVDNGAAPSCGLEQPWQGL